MKCLVPVLSFVAGGMTLFGIYAYTQNKSEVKKLMKAMSDFTDSMSEQVKNMIKNK